MKNSSYWVEDGSYLKVKNITLSYDITSPKLKRINITRIQPYISLQTSSPGPAIRATIPR